MKRFRIIQLFLLVLFVASCSSPDVTLTVDQIEQLKKVQFYNYQVSGLKVKIEKEGTILDDKLVGFYEGNVKLGVDFEHLKNSISPDRKSVEIKTKIVILNSENGFVSTTPKYMEEGTFSNKERAQLDSMANAQILERCKSENGFAEAEKNAREHMTKILNGMGFEKVIINFEK